VGWLAANMTIPCEAVRAEPPLGFAAEPQHDYHEGRV